jgi:Secretion system C-terminal sorting domain
MINPSRITQDGLFWRVTGIEISETPIYLRINQRFMKDDPIVKPVSNLTASCQGCSSTAKVTWQIPSGANYSFYRVYRSDCTLAAFDVEKVVLVAENLLGSATSAFIDQVSTTTCTKIWIVPFVSTLNGEMGFVQAMGSVQSAIYNPSSCQSDPCVTNLSGQVKVLVAPPQGFIDGTAQSLFIPGANICSDLSGGVSGGVSLYKGATLQFEVNFTNPQFINTLNIFYGTGAGRITIETKEDCCSNYTNTFKFDINNISAGGNNRWISFSNSILNQTRVERMRITIEGQTYNSNGFPETGLSIGRMYFCTSPAPEVCPEDELVEPPVDQISTIDTVQEATATSINTHSAVIGWNTVMYKRAGQSMPVGGYLLKYSTQIDAEGKLVQPELLQVDGIPYDGGNNEVPLTPLVPNTNYYVEVIPDPSTVPCKASIPPNLPKQGTRLTFKTLAEEEEPTQGRLQSSNSTYQDEPPVMILYPNPTRDHLNITLDQVGQYTEYIIHTINGIRQKEGVLDAKNRNQRIDLPRLAPGMYLVTLLGSQVRPQTKTFIIVDKD